MPADVRMIVVNRIHRDPAPLRQHLDVIDPDDLIAAVHGIDERLVVRYVPSQLSYFLVMGDNILRTAQRHARPLVEALVLNDAEDGSYEVLAHAVGERVGRSGITPLEEAVLFERLTRHYSEADIASRCNQPVSYVRQRLDLLHLCPPGQAALSEGRLPEGLAWHISRLVPALQYPFLDRWLSGEFATAGAAEAVARELPTVS